MERSVPSACIEAGPHTRAGVVDCVATATLPSGDTGSTSKRPATGARYLIERAVSSANSTEEAVRDGRPMCSTNVLNQNE
jgi:hypothetical protein